MFHLFVVEDATPFPSWQNVFKNHQILSIEEVPPKKSIDIVQDFMNGISFNRIETDYEMLGDMGKKLLQLIFTPLIKELGKENIVNFNESNKIIKFMKFYIKLN